MDAVKYKTSFVNAHMLAYIIAEDDASRAVKIKLNFPLLPAILKRYLHKKVSKWENKISKVSGYNAIKGYLMEVEFFDCTDLDITISLPHKETATILFNGYHIIHENDVVKSISRNTLYHLRSEHPIIDGMGLLKNEIGEDWLVFIQVSLKQYEKHDTNLNTLLTNKKGKKVYRELKNDDSPSTIFDYYQQLSGLEDGDSHILYLYVSTCTYFNGDKMIFEKMLSHSQGKCWVGLLSSETTLYKEFIHLNICPQ